MCNLLTPERQEMPCHANLPARVRTQAPPARGRSFGCQTTGWEQTMVSTVTRPSFTACYKYVRFSFHKGRSTPRDDLIITLLTAALNWYALGNKCVIPRHIPSGVVVCKELFNTLPQRCLNFAARVGRRSTPTCCWAYSLRRRAYQPLSREAAMYVVAQAPVIRRRLNLPARRRRRSERRRC